MQTQEELLRLFDQQQRIDMEYPGVRKDVLLGVVRFVRPAPGMSFILYSHLDDRTADQAIDEQVAYFLQLNRPVTWKVHAHDAPSDMPERLAGRGFVPDEQDAVMLLDLHHLPDSLLQPIQADVRQLTRREQLEEVISVEQQVWGGDFSWMRQRLGGHLEVPGYLSIYMAYVQDTPACVGWTYFHPNSLFADIWGGSTVPAYRKQGLYTAMLASRVQEAAHRGVRYLIIDAGEMSRPIVAKHGFQLLTYATDYEWQPEKAPA
jgi:GNAT superfamily N-acetyltransferase